MHFKTSKNLRMFWKKVSCPNKKHQYKHHKKNHLNWKENTNGMNVLQSIKVDKYKFYIYCNIRACKTCTSKHAPRKFWKKVSCPNNKTSIYKHYIQNLSFWILFWKWSYYILLQNPSTRCDTKILYGKQNICFISNWTQTSSFSQMVNRSQRYD